MDQLSFRGETYCTFSFFANITFIIMFLMCTVLLRYKLFFV